MSLWNVANPVEPRGGVTAEPPEYKPREDPPSELVRDTAPVGTEIDEMATATDKLSFADELPVMLVSNTVKELEELTGVIVTLRSEKLPRVIPPVGVPTVAEFDAFVYVTLSSGLSTSVIVTVMLACAGQASTRVANATAATHASRRMCLNIVMVLFLRKSISPQFNDTGGPTAHKAGWLRARRKVFVCRFIAQLPASGDARKSFEPPSAHC